MSQPSTKKGNFTAAVLSNRRIGACFWKMDLEFTGDGAKAFAGFQPGQFLQIDVSEIGLPPEDQIPPHLRDACKRSVILRRPFSFAEVTAKADRTTAELLYCVLGPASVRLSALQAGDHASIIGPLGNGFSVPKGKQLALLLVGGMGAPPIRCLAKHLRAEHPEMKAIAFVGAKSIDALPFEGNLEDISSEVGPFIPAFAKFGIPSAVATDDGSAGYWGFITDRLTKWLDEQRDWSPAETVIYACGPEPMLAAVARVAGQRGIDCQVSMERRMACGIGLCQSCAVEYLVEGSSETIYKLCCQDGPVFDASNVIFGEGARGTLQQTDPPEDNTLKGDPKDLIREHCPNLWSLLKSDAQKNLPEGLKEYLSGVDASTGLSYLKIADAKLAYLFERLDRQQVPRAYQKDLSGVNNEQQLSEQLCEIALAAELSKLSVSTPVLRPSNGKGKKRFCDIKISIGGVDLYVECKRYADRGPRGSRSLVKSVGDKSDNERAHSPCAMDIKPDDEPTRKPRAMDLRKKLRDTEVYDQFPQGTLNIVFLFHPSWAGDGGSLGHPMLKDSALVIHQALFGDKALSKQGSEIHLYSDGLFMGDEWTNVSGFIYGTIDLSQKGKLIIGALWRNPRAGVKIPESVWTVLGQQHG